MFRVWAVIFKMKDYDQDNAEVMIAEYYKSLRHLSISDFENLTEELKRTYTFFPSIKECLDIAGHNISPRLGVDDIGSDAWWEAARHDAKLGRLGITSEEDYLRQWEEREKQLEGPSDDPR